MKTKTIESIFLKSALVVSMCYLAHISDTNAQFKSESFYDQNNIEAYYWIKPNLSIIEDNNNYKYNRSENIDMEWNCKTTDSTINIKYEIFVRTNSSKDFYKYDTVANKTSVELSYEKVMSATSSEETKDEIEFDVKIKAIDSHNLADTAISKKYVYFKVKDTDEENNKHEDKNTNEDTNEKLPTETLMLGTNTTEPAGEIIVDGTTTKVIETPTIEPTLNVTTELEPLEMTQETSESED